MKKLNWLIVPLFALLLAACGDNDQSSAPETSDTAAASAMVSIANPYAAEAAMDILNEGGTAIDAAIAALAVLGLVEPQSSGIGGGGFLLYYDAESGEVSAYDGRETAPNAIRPEHFQNPDGSPRSFFDIVRGGTSVGVPGSLAVLELVHEAHGNLPWGDLFDGAIALAEDGFEISPRLRWSMTRAPWTAQMPDTVAYFYDEAGAVREAGSILQNMAYGETLRTIAAEGADAFYEGDLAEAIVAKVTRSEINPGLLSVQDMAGYTAVERDVICTPYRAYQICGMPPPTSGSMIIQMVLGMVEGYDLAALEPGSAEAVHLISEASRLAFADRDMFIADSDFVAVPTLGLVSEDYLARRASLISPLSSLGVAAAGNPWPDEMEERSPDETPDVPGTNHMSIVDGYGNAVSFNSSVESVFGSHLMVGGFFLNNQLTDFSRALQRDGRPIANGAAPGKRPRSSMAPIIILDEAGELFAVIGSSGGSRIPLAVAQDTIAIIDWNMGMQEALDLPRHSNRNGSTDLEVGTELAEIAPTLEAMGHVVRQVRFDSGTHGIMIRDGVMEGGADPRREGVVLSDQE